MKNFVLIGAGGYVAPRHMKAIRDTGNNLLAVIDKHDSLGVLDSYFPQADFFTEFERFDRHLEKLKKQGTAIDYVSVCTPNYLHDAHIRFGLRTGADVICEKPVVLNPWNLDALADAEKATGKKINGILQLRLHPAMQELKRKIESSTREEKYKVKLEYITGRGNWYHYSWKGDPAKSGGIASNIGIHFFDLLQWLFGEVTANNTTAINNSRASGILEMKKASVAWKLSIDENDLPEQARAEGKRSWRLLQVDDDTVEFSELSDELHTKSYAAILQGEGFGLKELQPAVAIAYAVRNSAAAKK